RVTCSPESATPGRRPSIAAISIGTVNIGRPPTTRRTAPSCRGSGSSTPSDAAVELLGVIRLFRTAGRSGLHPEPLPDPLLDVGHQRWIVLQEHLRVLAALPDPLVAEGIPRAGLLNDVRLGGEIDEQAAMADPLLE